MTKIEEGKKILRLSLKKKWFDMISSGEKTEEYREIKEYWVKRLVDFKDKEFNYFEQRKCCELIKEYGRLPAATTIKKYDYVEFTLGYPKKEETSKRMMFEVKDITIGKGNSEWGGSEDLAFVIKFCELGKCKTNYNFVDLALPSGTKWADRNVGAADEYSTGLYFQWGDTVGYTAEQVGNVKCFNWIDYKYEVPSSKTITEVKELSDGLIKYNNIDGKKVLDLEDDAARVHMGGNAKMPTIEQYQELINNTTQEYSSENGGYIKFISKKDSSKFIVLSASGCALSGCLNGVGQYGFYWSSSLYSVYVLYACYCDFFVEYEDVRAGGYGNRCNGLPVRGVLMA